MSNEKAITLRHLMGAVSALLNKLSTKASTEDLSDVAFSGDYGDLNGKPDLGSYMVKGTDYVTAGQLTGNTLGEYATAEGRYVDASGNYSHAEGSGTIASGNYSHAEGSGTIASGGCSHAEGIITNASGASSHAEGDTTVASGDYSHAEGYHTTANHKSQNVFGEHNILDSNVAAATARGTYVEIVGNGTSSTRSNARTLDWNGNEILAGKLTVGVGPTNNMDVATKQYTDTAIANGNFMVKSVDYVTAGQLSGTTLGTKATAEGYQTTATANYSHAEGNHTTASGIDSHAEGLYTTASGSYSHAEGVHTTAQRRSQHVFGEYNVLDATGSNTSNKGSYVEIVGNGDSNARSNARTLDWSGNETLAGKLTVGANPVNNMDVVTKQYMENKGYLTLATLPVYDGTVV